MTAMLKMRINNRIRLYKRITDPIEIPYIIETWKRGLRGVLSKADKYEIFYTIKSSV